MASSVGMQGTGGGFTATTKFPPLELLDAIVFSGFAGVSLILALSLFGYRSSFKPADVDVLFPTPINPRTVLLFRILRDYLGTLLLPLFLVLVAWRPLQLETYFKDVPHPQSASYALRALSLGFLLISTTWVGIGYALSLYLNRNDRRSDLRKRIVGWAIALPVGAVLVYVVRSALLFASVADFIRFTQQGWLRAFFFTATPATEIVMGPLEGNTSEVIFGTFSLVAISSICLYLALRQAEWMYDQAAVRGFGAESMRQLQRRGDFVGVVAEAARRGKVKVRKPGWFQRLRTRGIGAFLWKDALIQWRSMKAMVIIFLLVGLTFITMPYVVGLREKREGIGFVILGMEGFVSFMVATTTSQTGLTELLRRVDLQKPMPFGPQVIVMSEVLAKSLPAAIIPLLCSLVGLILFPTAWAEVLAGAIFFPSLGAVICAVVCIIVLLFPEIEDVSQRGFRGLMMLICLVFVGVPGVALFVLVGIFTKSAIIGAIPGGIMNLCIALGLTGIAGSLYASFNPSE